MCIPVYNATSITVHYTDNILVRRKWKKLTNGSLAWPEKSDPHVTKTVSKSPPIQVQAQDIEVNGKKFSYSHSGARNKTELTGINHPRSRAVFRVRVERGVNHFPMLLTNTSSIEYVMRFTQNAEIMSAVGLYCDTEPIRLHFCGKVQKGYLFWRLLPLFAYCFDMIWYYMMPFCRP